MATNELVVNGLSAGYGGITAVWDLDLNVRPRTITALLGRNGAGKTTTLHAIAGLVQTSRGSIELGGNRLDGLPAYRRVGHGISLVQEGKQIFRHLTVEENLLLGCYPSKRSRRALRAEIEDQLSRFPMLRERIGERAGSLSGGQQQMLAIAQALLARPKILMLDEPSAGLAPGIVSDVFATIRRLADEGIGVLLVEQLVERTMEIADVVVVLDVGRAILRHETSMGRDPAVVEAAYFGRS